MNLIDLGNGIFLNVSTGETKEDFNLYHNRREGKERRIAERRIINLESTIENRKEERRKEERRFIPTKEMVLNDLRKYGYSVY